MNFSTFGKNSKYYLTQTSNSLDPPPPPPLIRRNDFYDVQTRGIAKKVNKNGVEVLVSYFSCNISVLSETSLRKLSEGEGTSCSQQTLYLKYKWQEQDLNSEPLSS